MTPMAIGIGVGLSFAPVQGGGGAIVGPYPPPTGYEWAYLTSNGNQLQTNGNNLVILKRAA